MQFTDGRGTQEFSIDMPSPPRSKRLLPPAPVQAPGIQQPLDTHQATAGIVHLIARMDAIGAWAMTVSETVSANDLAVDRKFAELLSALGTKATIKRVMDLEENMQTEAMLVNLPILLLLSLKTVR